MSPVVSEHSFENAIECGLLRYGPDACPEGGAGLQERPEPWGEMPPGGYRRRMPEDYDRALCLIPRDVVDFVLATQPKEWRRLSEHYGAAVRERFVGRLASEIERRGSLDVLRNGIRDSGVKFQLAYFRPASGLNEETQRLHAGNLFAVVRQLRYSTRNEKNLDLVLFLNGIPIFTAELKNPLTGQEVENAIRQYKTTATRVNRSLAMGGASRISRSIRNWSMSLPISPDRTRAFCRSIAGDSAGPAIRRCRRRGPVTLLRISGKRPGRATACSTSCGNSSMKSRRRTIGGARPASAF
jgi:hypothetical protein